MGSVAPAATSAATTPSAGVTVEEAVTIALDAVGGGDVVETDLDEFEVAVQVWEITVVTPDGVRRQITVDLANGSVVGNELDD